VNRNGVQRMLQIELDESETKALQHSADVLKGTIAKIL
jgi:malate/lactate dehydrogenase